MAVMKFTRIVSKIHDSFVLYFFIIFLENGLWKNESNNIIPIHHNTRTMLNGKLIKIEVSDKKISVLKFDYPL